MGGKTGTTTSSTSIPPEVLARYNSVNATAEKTASTPFQPYSSDPNAFVAPLTQQQQTGVSNVNAYANSAQPAYQAAMAGTAGAYQGYNAPNYQQGVQAYMNPFLQNAMGATAAQMQNVNQQEQQKMLGSSIGQGAFGGDRANIGLGALENQQNLAMGQTLGQMASQGYQSAAQNYLSGLGQQGALSAQMGQLGAGAQTAGLQGAQAQLGAGTLGQQTEQAGKTALYNQYQQGQAYPFQVAQFLANIAEGTGALSGSTTTQNAPQSFFSDRRLKEDIKQVGKSDNGLPIYKFKYKGDPAEQTHIGYMAQDVEKVHPEAVGESHGFKTVDYDKASRPAHYSGGVVYNSEGGAVLPQHMGEGFSRGGYFDGGNVVSPNDIATILASQQQSYAPFQQGGIYGAASSSTPGGKGIVPSANLPVARLQPAEIKNTGQGETFAGDVHSLSNIGDDISKINQYRKDIIGHKAVAAKEAVPANPNARTAAQNAVPAQEATGLSSFFDKGIEGQYRGGVVGYADGGDVMPYKTDDPMQNVVESGEKKPSELKLLQAHDSLGGQGNSTMSDIGTALTIGKDIASIAPFFLKNGGRAGFEDGGTPDDSIWNKNIQAESGGNQFDKSGAPLTSPKGAVGLAQVMPATAPDAAKLAGLSFDPDRYHNDPEYNKALGKAYFDQQVKTFGDPEKAVAAYNAGPGRVAQAISMAAKSGGDYKDYLPAETKNHIGKVLGNAADLPAPNAAPAQAVTSPQGGIVPPESDQKPSMLNNIGEKLGSEQFLVPLLAGLGTMAGSKSRYLGSAILEGIGGGAKAYEDVQGNIAGRGLTTAQTAQQQALTRGEDITNYQKSFQQTPYGNLVWLADGSFINADDYDRLRKSGKAPPLLGRVPGGVGTAPTIPIDQGKPAGSDVIGAPLPASMTAPAPKGTDIGQAPTDFYDEKSSDAAMTERQQRNASAISGGPSALIPIERSKIYIDNVDKVGSAARNNQQNVHELASNLADVAAAKGWNAPGTAYTTRAQISGLINTFARAFGKPDILESDTPAQVSDKLRTIQGLMAASGAGQESVRALDELANANANPSQNPKAFARLTSMLMTQTQRGIDQANHANLYGRDSGNSYVNASADFERKNPSARYGTEAKAIENVMINDPALFQQMISGNMDPARIDKLFETHGFHGMSRYFTGGR